MKVKTEIKEAVNTALTTLMKGKPLGGELTVDTIQRKVGSTVSRPEVINALRHNMRGVFIPGRRGFKSRFAFGEYVPEKLEKPTNSGEKADETETENNEETETETETNPPVSAFNKMKSRTHLQDFGIRIAIGDRETVIPFKVDVVPV